MGFVSKSRAQELLMATPPGTFLLRYSDTELGGISIVYNTIESGEYYIYTHNMITSLRGNNAGLVHTL